MELSLDNFVHPSVRSVAEDGKMFERQMMLSAMVSTRIEV